MMAETELIVTANKAKLFYSDMRGLGDRCEYLRLSGQGDEELRDMMLNSDCFQAGS